MDYSLYIATVLGAAALLMIMPRGRRSPLPKLGGLLGAATLGGLWLYLARALPEGWGISGGAVAMTYYYIFSAIAVVSAVRVITHTKPVYAALWFVMVMLATAGMFLLVGAEFMAFALVIIYGGAILVTYVFVIMLAAQAAEPGREEQTPAYDRVAWEPMAAVVAGFLLMAMVLSVVFPAPGLALEPNPAAAELSDQQILATTLTHRTPERLAHPGTPQPAAGSSPLAAQARQVTNVERIGLDLFQGNILGLELAGVILLVSLVGAVVIAKQQVPEESEKT